MEAMVASAKRRLVLITGAGASRNFGRGEGRIIVGGLDGPPLPLMADWSNRLVATLDSGEEGLASAIGLRRDMDGEEFEEALGQFLQWTQAFPSPGPFKQFDRDPDSQMRVKKVIRLVNQSLWREFGWPRINSGKASETYAKLLAALDALPPLGGGPEEVSTRLFSATTNYDSSGERALSSLGLTPDIGQQHEEFGQTPYLKPDFVAWEESLRVPYLHLHGAVGWYREPGPDIRIIPPTEPRISIHHLDQPYDDRLSPAILYPDPRKNPFDVQLGVHALWRKLKEALETATHVLVLGHSLHDRPLLDALAESAKSCRQTRFAFCYYGDQSPLETVLNNDTTFGRPSVDIKLVAMDFQPQWDFTELERWVNGETGN